MKHARERSLRDKPGLSEPCAKPGLGVGQIEVDREFDRGDGAREHSRVLQELVGALRRKRQRMRSGNLHRS